MSKTITGFINRVMKPTVLITTGNRKTFSAVVDTAFNGMLWFSEEDASKLGVVKMIDTKVVYTASGEGIEVDFGALEIFWFGELRTAYVYIAPKKKASGFKPYSKKTEVDILLGTRLLHPNKLVINFLDQTVEIVGHE